MRPGFIERVAAILLFMSSASAQDDVLAGTLSCESQPTTGLLVVQSQKLTCLFEPVEPGAEIARYDGSIVDFGPPIGQRRGTKLIWQVRALPGRDRQLWLAGDYVAAGTTLRGGPKRNVYLEAISVDGSSEQSFAATVTALSLVLRAE